MIASTRPMPAARRSIAKSTNMMAFLVTIPISIRMPITTGMLMGCPVSSSAAITPPRLSGKDSRMVIGWNTLRNSSTSTPRTIVSPAPIASPKEENTSAMISASPPFLRPNARRQAGRLRQRIDPRQRRAEHEVAGQIGPQHHAAHPVIPLDTGRT